MYYYNADIYPTCHVQCTLCMQCSTLHIIIVGSFALPAWVRPPLLYFSIMQMICIIILVQFKIFSFFVCFQLNLLNHSSSPRPYKFHHPLNPMNSYTTLRIVKTDLALVFGFYLNHSYVWENFQKLLYFKVILRFNKCKIALTYGDHTANFVKIQQCRNSKNGNDNLLKNEF